MVCRWRAIACSTRTKRPGASSATARGRTNTGSPTPSPGSARRAICGERTRRSAAVAAASGRAQASVRGFFPALAQEAEKLDAFPQSALHHLRAARHLRHDRCDLRRAEIEASIERLDGMEDLRMAEMGVVQRRDLHAALVHELGVGRIEPSVLERLAVEIRSRIRRRERYLDRVR